MVAPLKDQIQNKRSELRATYLNGASGRDISSALASFASDIISQLYTRALGEIDVAVRHELAEGLSLVALGGFGRGEMAPHSDIDLMFLYHGSTADSAREISSVILRQLWDSGYQVGHSVRTIQDCLALGKRDVSAKTALMESRYIVGSRPLFRTFHERFEKRIIAHSVDEFLAKKIEEREREYERYGASVYMLEPDVKRSRGGLRDLHLIQWAALARYRATSLEELRRQALLSSKEYRALRAAAEFLWRIRAELHFHAGSAQDILSFDEQVRVAALFGFSNEKHMLGVEQFMQQYYRHTTALADISSRFLKRCRKGSVFGAFMRLLPSKRPEVGFVIRNNEITIDPAFRGMVLSSGPLLVRLFFLSVREGVSIADDLLDELYVQIDGMVEDQFSDESVQTMFLAILAGPHDVAPVLALMHRVHLLEKLIPAFAPARGLMQFNQYHKFTVDEHSIRAVACAEAFAKHQTGPGGRSDLCRVYHDLRRKDLLYLALLLHDLGKGKQGDHCLIGAHLARETARRLGLDTHDSDLLVFLVQYHLKMSHIAFRRDLSDPKVITQFAKHVGTPEVLMMFYVLTAADIAAVGPGTWTTWKEDLLTELFLRTLDAVAGGSMVLDDRDAKVTESVTARLLETPPPPWWTAGQSGAIQRGWREWIEKQIAVIPVGDLIGWQCDEILEHLEWVHRLTADGVLVDVVYHEDRERMEITVYAYDDLTPGIFAKLAGVMAAKGLQVLGARITTRRDGVVIDAFQVVDEDYAGAPPDERMEEIGATIRGVLTGTLSLETLMSQGTRRIRSRLVPPRSEPPNVQIDNESSDRFTIIDIFADDRQGLLYVIANAVFELGLSVHTAKISTKLDQVVDVLYVSDACGQKVTGSETVHLIQQRLLSDIRTFIGDHEEQQVA